MQPLTAMRLTFRLCALPLALLLSCFALASCDFFREASSELAFKEAEANMGQWTWVDVAGAQCRDGSATSLGVRLQENADDLVIFMEGGRGLL